MFSPIWLWSCFLCAAPWALNLFSMCSPWLWICFSCLEPLECPACSHSMASMSTMFVCVCGTSWVTSTIQGSFLSHGSLHWAASSMGSNMTWSTQWEIKPWLSSEAFYYAMVLHYDSGWQTWIGLFPGFQEEYDPKNWEVLNHLGKFPSGPRQPRPQRATSSLVAPWDPTRLAAVPEIAPEDEVEPCWKPHRFLCFTQTPNDTSQDVLWKKRFQVYHCPMFIVVCSNCRFSSMCC